MENKKAFFGSKSVPMVLLAAFVGLGGIMAFLGSGTDSGRLLSQFSGTGVVPATASERWKPTEANPYRPAISNYAGRVDALVVNILARWGDLRPDRYRTYLDTIVTRFDDLLAGPEYANDTEIIWIVKYLGYELADASKTFQADARGFDRLIEIVDLTDAEMHRSGTGSSDTGSGSAVTSSGSVAFSGSSDPVLGTYRLYLSGSQIPEITKEYVTETGGLASCTESHDSDPKFTNISVRCTWEAPCPTSVNGGLGCTPPNARTKEIYSFTAVATFSVKGSFWANYSSGATVSGCGKTAIAGADGKFNLADIKAGSDCRNITATKTGSVCTITTDGPEKLDREVSDVAGTCALKMITIKYSPNGGGTIQFEGTPNEQFVESKFIHAFVWSYGSTTFNSSMILMRKSYDLKKPRHTFGGWSADPVGGRKIDDSERMTEDLTLYAIWIPYANDAFTMSFDQNGGTDPIPKMQFKTKNAKVGAIVIPTPWDGSNPPPFRSGFTFDGWWTAPTGGTKITPDFVITGDMKAYAHWREYAFSLNGTDYAMTPPGCNDKPVPTCEGTVELTKDTVTKSWANAKTYCENLTFNGHADWFLPNKDELGAMYAATNRQHGFSETTPGYQHTQGSLGYWSSTENDAATAFNHSWGGGQTMTTADKNLTILYARCVRKVS